MARNRKEIAIEAAGQNVMSMKNSMGNGVFKVGNDSIGNTFYFVGTEDEYDAVRDEIFGSVRALFNRRSMEFTELHESEISHNLEADLGDWMVMEVRAMTAEEMVSKYENMLKSRGDRIEQLIEAIRNWRLEQMEKFMDECSTGFAAHAMEWYGMAPVQDAFCRDVARQVHLAWAWYKEGNSDHDGLMKSIRAIKRNLEDKAMGIQPWGSSSASRNFAALCELEMVRKILSKYSSPFNELHNAISEIRPIYNSLNKGRRMMGMEEIEF